MKSEIRELEGRLERAQDASRHIAGVERERSRLVLDQLRGGVVLLLLIALGTGVFFGAQLRPPMPLTAGCAETP